MKYKTQIERQAEALRDSHTATSATLAGLDLALAAGARIIFCGIGASYSTALVAAHQARKAGYAGFAMQPTEFTETPVAADLVVLVSSSGRSLELIEAAKICKAAGTPTIAVSRLTETPLAEVSDMCIGFRSGPDATPSSTGYVGSLLACGMLLSHLGKTSEDALWQSMPAEVAGVLRKTELIRDTLQIFARPPQAVDYVGGAGALGTALGAMLMLRESSRIASSGENTRHYLHGPMEIMTPETAAVLFGDGRETEIATFLERIGCPTLLVTTRGDIASSELRAVAQVPAMPNAIAQALVDIVPAQLFAARMSDLLGLTDTLFRYRQSDTKDRTGQEGYPQPAKAG